MTSTTHYADLGPFSDLVAAAEQRSSADHEPISHGNGTHPAELTRRVLGFSAEDEAPTDVRVETQWERAGVAGAEISWSVGYGPRTHAFVVKPADADEPLPGIVALHSHDGFTYYGKEKVCDGPDGMPQALRTIRERGYGDRPFAEALALEGYVVLAPDVFCWGSRRFPFDSMPNRVREVAEALTPTAEQPEEVPEEIVRHNIASHHHEQILEKYCTVLGTTMAGVVAAEDRAAVAYLISREDVREGPVGCVGMSGGGARAALLHATCDRIGAAVVVAMMTTYAGLLDHNIASHTWMLFPAGWARHGDWPDLAAARAPVPLMVQYAMDDGLFTPAGMKDAHQRLTERYTDAGAADAYEGQFYDGPHRFDVEMQDAAFAWLSRMLSHA